MLFFKTYLVITRKKNIRRYYKNNKLKIIAPTWNDEFELSDDSYSVSNIQDYFEFIIKKYETLATIKLMLHISHLHQ